jgi:hypothetical protein
MEKMSNAREQMKIMEAELANVREQIARLKIKEETIVQLLAKVSGTANPDTATRARSPAVKPVVLDIMREKGAVGATSGEVDALVRQKVPTVGKDTVGSVLSRLKSDGALGYDGERYYEKQFTPKIEQSPFDGRSRAVN